MANRPKFLDSVLRAESAARGGGQLDYQLAKTFKAICAVSEAEGNQCHAASSAHLRGLLRGNHRYVLTLIHKFQPKIDSG